MTVEAAIGVSRGIVRVDDALSLLNTTARVRVRIVVGWQPRLDAGEGRFSLIACSASQAAYDAALLWALMRFGWER